MKESIEQLIEKVYQAACYACHNHAVNPEGNPPAVELDGGRWVHGSEVSKTGYIGCYADRYRKIFHDYETEKTGSHS